MQVSCLKVRPTSVSCLRCMYNCTYLSYSNIVFSTDRWRRVTFHATPPIDNSVLRSKIKNNKNIVRLNEGYFFLAHLYRERFIFNLILRRRDSCCKLKFEKLQYETTKVLWFLRENSYFNV